ncbi:MAG: hypothetical protein ABIU11_00015, partial [Chitinophagaceae bacterium]
MDKIQIIEKLFSYLLVHSYLLLPLAFIFSRAKKNPLIISLLIYGLIFYFFLNFYFEVPKEYRKLEQALYTTLEYSFFAFIFWSNIKQHKVRKIILLFSILFYVFQTIHFFSSELQRIDSVPVGIETILILIYIFIYFHQYFNENRTTFIYNDAGFWIVVGILLYLGCNLFFTILANQLSKEYWYLTYIPEIIKNILFAISIIIYKNKPS